VGSQWLTAWAMVRPKMKSLLNFWPTSTVTWQHLSVSPCAASPDWNQNTAGHLTFLTWLVFTQALQEKEQSSVWFTTICN
jgi:hypothetical protein